MTRTSRRRLARPQLGARICSGWRFGAPQPRTVDLVTGFNLVMWTGPDAAPIGEALADALDATMGVFTWNASEQRFLSFSPGVPALLNSLHELNHGDGLWIRVDRPVAWPQPQPARLPANEPTPEASPSLVRATAFR